MFSNPPEPLSDSVYANSGLSAALVGCSQHRASFHLPRLNVGSHPFALGGFGDVYEGTLDGSKVSARRMQMNTKCRQEDVKVRC